MDETRLRAQTERYEVSHRLYVHHFNVVTRREVFHICHTIDDSQSSLTDAIKRILASHLSSKGMHTFLDMLESFRSTEVVEEESLQSTHRLHIAFGTYGAKDSPFIVCQQFVQDMHTQITSGSRQQHVAYSLSFATKEGIEVVSRKNALQFTGCHRLRIFLLATALSCCLFGITLTTIHHLC